MTDKLKKPKKDKYEGVPDYSGLNPATGRPWTGLEVAQATTVADYIAWRKATGTLQPTGELDPDEYERTMLVVFAHPQRELLDVYCKVRGCGKSLGGFTFYDGTWSFIAWGHGGVESDCFTTAPTMNHPPFRLPTRRPVTLEAEAPGDLPERP